MAYEIAITLGLQATAFCLFFLGMKLKGDRHAPLQILFTAIGLYLTLTNIDIMAKIADANGKSAIESVLYSDYTILMYTVIFFVFYVIVFFIWEALSKTHKAKW